MLWAALIPQTYQRRHKRHALCQNFDLDQREEEQEEEEEAPKPKKEKVNFDELSLEEKWQFFSDKSINPGDDVSFCFIYSSFRISLSRNS